MVFLRWICDTVRMMLIVYSFFLYFITLCFMYSLIIINIYVLCVVLILTEINYFTVDLMCSVAAKFTYQALYVQLERAAERRHRRRWLRASNRRPTVSQRPWIAFPADGNRSRRQWPVGLPRCSITHYVLLNRVHSLFGSIDFLGVSVAPAPHTSILSFNWLLWFSLAKHDDKSVPARLVECVFMCGSSLERCTTWLALCFNLLSLVQSRIRQTYATDDHCLTEYSSWTPISAYLLTYRRNGGFGRRRTDWRLVRTHWTPNEWDWMKPFNENAWSWKQLRSVLNFYISICVETVIDYSHHFYHHNHQHHFSA